METILRFEWKFQKQTKTFSESDIKMENNVKHIFIPSFLNFKFLDFWIFI